MEAREMIIKYGTAYVTEEDLLGIIIDDADKTKKLLDSFCSDIAVNQSATKKMLYESFAQLKYRGKLTPKQTLRLAACIELAKRLGEKTHIKNLSARMPEEICSFLMPRYRYEAIEHFLVVCLNSKNKIMKIKDLFKGGITGTIVDCRTVFNEAIIEHATAILVVHNHPSGDPRASDEDKVITKQLVDSGKILGIPVLDHIILGDNCYFSFHEEGLIN